MEQFVIFESCPQEKEVAISVREGRWPMACDPALRAHVGQCRRCGDFVVMALALSDARAAAVENADLALSPGQLWWKAQLRRRNRDLQRVSAPVSVAGMLAMSISALAAVGLVFWQRTQIAAWISQFAGTRAGDVFGSDGVWTQGAAWMLLLLIISLGTLVLFGMLVLYLAVQRE